MKLSLQVILMVLLGLWTAEWFFRCIRFTHGRFRLKQMISVTMRLPSWPMESKWEFLVELPLPQYAMLELFFCCNCLLISVRLWSICVFIWFYSLGFYQTVIVYFLTLDMVSKISGGLYYILRFFLVSMNLKFRFGIHYIYSCPKDISSLVEGILWLFHVENFMSKSSLEVLFC